MTGGPENWFDRLWGNLDTATRRLQRHCPKCNGDLYREFSILDKVGLYIPLPHTIYALHRCERCRARYRSFRSFTDLFLETSWMTALFCLGEWWPLALACTITWLTYSFFLQSGTTLSADTVAAGVVTGIIWTLALIFGNTARGDFLMTHPFIMVPVTALLTLGPVWIVLVLDRYTNFRLREC